MVSEIKKHITEHSSSAIRLRAEGINLNLETKRLEKYFFSFQGTYTEPYKIVAAVDGRGIKTSCTCPYNVDGMCKHEVAALNYVIDQYKITNPILNLFGEIEPGTGENGNQLVLKNHEISDELIARYAKKYRINHLNTSNINIVKFDTGYLETELVGWYDANQKYNYNPETSVLTTACNCKRSKNKLCEHVLSGLKKMLQVFGKDVFKPTFVDDKKQEFLEWYGLTLEDDYHKYFDFSLGVKGLRVTEKVKNLMPSSIDAKERFIPELDKMAEDALLVPVKNEEHPAARGLGFCFDVFERNEKHYLMIYPFTAKYKKHSDEFASKFREIESFDFVSQMRGMSTEDKHAVMRSLEFQESYTVFLQEYDVASLRDTFISFANLMEGTLGYPFFLKSRKDTLVKRNIAPLKISDGSPELTFVFKAKKELFTLTPTLTIEGKKYQINSPELKIFPIFCVLKNTVYRFKAPFEFLYIDRFLPNNEVNFLKYQYNKLYHTFLKPISAHFEIKNEVFASSRNEIPEDRLKKQVFLSDFEGEFVLFKLGVQYDKDLILLHTKEDLYDEKSNRTIARDYIFESDFIDEFKALHEDFEGQEGVFYLKPLQLIEEQWLLNASEKMQQKGMEIFGAKDLKSFKFNLNSPVITMGVKSDIDWFELEINVQFGHQKVNLREIKKALINKRKFIKLGDGTLGIIPEEWLKKFASYFKAGEVKNNAIKISDYQFNIIDELYEGIDDAPGFLLKLQQKKERLLNLKKVKDVSIPKTVKAQLRPYQQEGLNWLNFLDENQLGGCLADDMGLGKTLQVIAFLAYLKAHKKTTLPNLVIAPTSLIFNWENEVEKFCPSLKVLDYIGSKRKEQVEHFSSSDIVLTTYGSVLNDIEVLREMEFSYVVLDESQAIKNPNSKRYKAVRLLQSKNRLVLTGTPIENNTFDLYAQMNFLNPGLLGSINHFKKEFSDAIDKAKNEEASILLGKMINPFLLRRTKSQVATELPEKTENVLYCDMGAEQRKVYDFFKDKYRNYLLDKFDEKGAAKSQIYVLEGLTKLRQICNSPELLNDEEDYGKASVKLDILIENIRSKTANNKVLVFSQFTSMLKLIKDRLDVENITYEYLDGQTRKRADKVSNFQETEGVRVFLISLKAGGVGINLTAADYVFLVDPWWNPAVESQAIDRTHRIGQTKHVIAYKMICKDTIEEKIVDLQKNKREVSSAVIQVDNVKKSFDKKEIMKLFG